MPYGCFVCHKKIDRPYKCSRCKSTIYCSKDCQIIDWAEHKKTCFQYKTLEEIERLRDNGLYKTSDCEAIKSPISDDEISAHLDKYTTDIHQVYNTWLSERPIDWNESDIKQRMVVRVSGGATLVHSDTLQFESDKRVMMAKNPREFVPIWLVYKGMTYFILQKNTHKK